MVVTIINNRVSKLIKPNQWVTKPVWLINCLVKVSPLPLGLIGLFRLVIPS